MCCAPERTMLDYCHSCPHPITVYLLGLLGPLLSTSAHPDVTDTSQGPGNDKANTRRHHPGPCYVPCLTSSEAAFPSLLPQLFQFSESPSSFPLPICSTCCSVSLPPHGASFPSLRAHIKVP